jgi:DNA polymerase-3 subunit delta'
MQFSEVLDQNRIKERLINSAKTGRVSHAQMIVGNEGAGGLPLALAYATYLSCSDKQDQDSCGKCSSCVKYIKLEHPDLHLFFPNNTGKDVKKNPSSGQVVNDWRKSVLKSPYLNLSDWLNDLGVGNKIGILSERDSAEILATTSLKNYESEYRIILIWMAEKMNESCANKILKVIEEPPPKTVFLLVVEDTENMLDTIQSRVQAVHLPPLNDEAIAERLIRDHELDSQSAHSIALRSDGNYHMALKLAHAGDDNDINEFFIRWMRLCFSGNSVEIFKLADEFHSLGRERQKEWLQAASNMLRKASIHKWQTNSGLVGEQEKFVANFAKFMDPLVSMKLLSILDEASSQISRNAFAKIVLADMSFSIGGILRQKAVS